MRLNLKTNNQNIYLALERPLRKRHRKIKESLIRILGEVHKIKNSWKES